MLIGYQGGNRNEQRCNTGQARQNLPSPDFSVQAGVVEGRVNLVYTGGIPLRFWDGNDPALWNTHHVNGGDGTWLTADNKWTTRDGFPNGPFLQDSIAVFQGKTGTVTVVDGPDGTLRVAASSGRRSLCLQTSQG